MRWKIVAALLAFFCAVLLYRVVDQAITLSYSDANQEGSSRYTALLKGLIEREWVGLPEEQVVAKLKAYVALQQPDAYIVLKREPDDLNAIYLESFRFEFRNSKLVKISSGFGSEK